jgi:hypothetical protein
MPMSNIVKQFQYGSTEDEHMGNDDHYRHSVFHPAKEFFDRQEATWKVLGLISGVAIAIVSLMDIYDNFKTFNIFDMIIHVCMSGFAIILAMLEYKSYLPKHYRVMIEREVHIMYTSYGRSGFYVVLGIMVFCQGSFKDLVVGSYSIAIGSYISCSSKKVDNELMKLLDPKFSDIEITKKFNEFDVDRNGYLDRKEIYELLKSVNRHLTPAKLEETVYKLDQNSDGRISKEEFVKWWSNAKKTTDSTNIFLSL